LFCVDSAKTAIIWTEHSNLAIYNETGLIVIEGLPVTSAQALKFSSRLSVIAWSWLRYDSAIAELS